MSERIVIIGASGYKSPSDGPTLDCYPWDRVNRIGNLSDYDKVILNLLSLTSIERVDWAAFTRLLDLRSMAEILGHNGRIIVLGDPRFTITTHRAEGGGRVGQAFLSWSGIEFGWDTRAGRSKECEFHDYEDRNAFGSFLSYLNAWGYSLASVQPLVSPLTHAFGLDQDFFGGNDLRLVVERDDFCTSRYDTLLAGALCISVQKFTGLYDEFRRRKYESVTAFGPIVLLPQTELSETESFTIILRDLCDIEVETPEPEWVVRMEAPGQAEVDKEIKSLHQEVRTLSQRIAAREAERANVRAKLKLLYEQHQVLEAVVQETLIDLGADFEPSDDPTKEDGWVRVGLDGGVREGVLEIKGTEKEHFTEQGLRQLREWVGRGIERQNKVYKGIFIGNAAVGKHPSERSDPFGANLVTNATLQDFVLLRAEDLYLAHQLNALGLLDKERFWRDVFNTRGVFDPTPYRRQLPFE